MEKIKHTIHLIVFFHFYFPKWLKFSHITGKLIFRFQTRIFWNWFSRIKILAILSKKIEKIKHTIRLIVFYHFYFPKWLKFSHLTGKLTFRFQTRIFWNWFSRIKILVILSKKKMEKIKHTIHLIVFFHFYFPKWLKFNHPTGKLIFLFQTRIYFKTHF